MTGYRSIGDGGPFSDTPFRHVRQPLDRLTDEERTAVESYALGGYERINSALRGFRPMTPDIEVAVGVLRTAIGKFPLQDDVRVTREVSASAFKLETADLAPQVVGRAFRDEGFLSTSMDAHPPRSTGRPNPLDLELLIPAGTHALAIGDLSEYPLERELLIIDARLILVVDSQHMVATSRWRLYGEIVDEEGVL